jgi:phospholipid N-methyltransferase
MHTLMGIARTLEPEWLDELPADDPRAMRSRRDLKRINALMTNSTLVARELHGVFHAKPPLAVAEIGAGDGTFMLRVAEKIPSRWRATDIVLVDRHNLVSAATRNEFLAMGWQARAVTSDAFAWLAHPAAPMFDVIVANLFLHHFDAARLTELLSLIARRTRVLIACEPRRSRGALLGSHLLGVVGCNDVSRHDAVVSVRAGFRNQELCALWPAGNAWTLQERAGGLFSHCFVAIRADGNAHAGSA